MTYNRLTNFNFCCLQLPNWTKKSIGTQQEVVQFYSYFLQGVSSRHINNLGISVADISMALGYQQP